MVFRGTTMAVSLLLVVATWYCFRIIPMGFIPSQDIGQLSGQTEMAQGLGFDSVIAIQQTVAESSRPIPTSSRSRRRSAADSEGRQVTPAACRSN